MPDERDYQDIKAGVDGILNDVPSPSEGTAQVTASEEAPMPTTSYAETTNYAAPEYNQQPQGYSGGGSQIDMERVHEIIEAIVGEK